MRNDLPTPDDVLEELADKTVAPIERLAPLAFDHALREMWRYHRFLLALSASSTPEGAAFSFAEIAGEGWGAPHREWMGQYRRLFARAADRIPDDDHFIHSLAYTPSRLLGDPSDPKLPPNVVTTILDLVPMMMHRLEAWVTKRTTLESREGRAAESRLALAGSDAKAYANALPEIVGAWETLLHRVPLMYEWQDEAAGTDVLRWSAFRASWPFLWQHLSNTAYCLAVAVWNEDEIGAQLFREALVRWERGLDYRLNTRAELRHRRLLFPSILQLDWPNAGKLSLRLGYDYGPPPTPDQVFASVLSGAHHDVVFLTASLLLLWTINEKQASDIGARTARSLLRGEGGDDDHRGGRNVSFRSLFLDVLRLEMAGQKYDDESYSAYLDGLVSRLDNMTERRIVPGRIFTPSTLHGRDGLLLSTVAILAAATPNEGDDGLVQRIEQMAREEEILPEGDRSLRDVIYELKRFRLALEQSPRELTRGVRSYKDSDDDVVLERLGVIVDASEATIESERLKRLKTRPADPKKLEDIRLAVEEALLNDPAEVPFFSGIRVVRAPRETTAEQCDMSFTGIDKAQLTEPPMESPSHGLEEMFVSGSRQMAGNLAWRDFIRRDRIKRTVTARAEDEAFWRDIAPLVGSVGPEPVLVVSRTAEGRALRRLIYASSTDRPNLRIERSQHEEREAYIATVEGVDVFSSADFPPSVAWLFSGRALRKIVYAKLDQQDRYVEVTFDPSDDWKGTLRLRVRQHLEWADTPIFELSAPDPDDEEEVSNPT